MEVLFTDFTCLCIFFARRSDAGSSCAVVSCCLNCNKACRADALEVASYPDRSASETFCRTFKENNSFLKYRIFLQFFLYIAIKKVDKKLQACYNNNKGIFQIIKVVRINCLNCVILFSLAVNQFTRFSRILITKRGRIVSKLLR